MMVSKGPVRETHNGKSIFQVKFRRLHIIYAPSTQLTLLFFICSISNTHHGSHTALMSRCYHGRYPQRGARHGPTLACEPQARPLGGHHQPRRAPRRNDGRRPTIKAAHNVGTDTRPPTIVSRPHPQPRLSSLHLSFTVTDETDPAYSPSCESQYPPAFLTEYKCALEPDSTGWRLYDETDIPDRVVAGSSFTKATYALVRKIKPSRPCQIPSKGATVKGPIGRCYCTYGCTGITAPITAAAATP